MKSEYFSSLRKEAEKRWAACSDGMGNVSNIIPGDNIDWLHLSPEDMIHIQQEINILHTALEMQHEHILDMQRKLEIGQSTSYTGQHSVEGVNGNPPKLDLEPFVKLSVDLMCIADYDGNILFLNPAWEKVLGYSLQEMMAYPLLYLVHPDDLSSTKNSILALKNGEPMIGFVNRFRAKDGSYHWLEWRAGPMQSRFSYAAARDITEQVQYQQQIEQIIQEWHETFDAMGHMILILDTNYNIVRYNKVCQTFLASNHENIQCHQCFTLVHHTNSPISQCFLDKVLATGQSMEEEVYDPYRQQYFRVRMDPIFDAHHKIKAIVHQIHDINIQKKAEENLRTLAQQAKAADAAKSQFLANMSHEIRTPLNGILGSISLLRETTLTSEQQEFLDTTHNSAELLLSIINDILDFSKIEAGRMSMDNAPFDFASMVEEAIASLWHQAYAKQIELICIIDHNIPEMMSGDIIRLKQVILNLVGNAIKFTNQGMVVITAYLAPANTTIVQQKGAIFQDLTVTLHHTTIVPDSKRRIIFSVQDTGIGIPPPKIEKLFIPFTQVNNSNTREYGGTGLGLVISKKLVTMMDGDMNVASIEGQGSNFAFTVTLDNVDYKTKTVKLVKQTQGMMISQNAHLLNALHEIFYSWKLEYLLFSDITAGIHEIESRYQQKNPLQIVLIDATSYTNNIALFIESLLAIKILESLQVFIIVPLSKLHETLQMTVPRHITLISKPLQRKKILAKLEIAASYTNLPYSSSVNPIVAKAASGTLRSIARLTQTVPSSPPSQLKILLAEDNLINQKVAQGILKILGYQHIDTVADAKGVFAALQHIDYELLLLDIQMPGMDGYEITQCIRKTPSRYSNIPIVAVTAHAMNEDRDKCLAAGMNGYVAKPVTKQSLDMAIREAYVQRQTNTVLPLALASKESIPSQNPLMLKGVITPTNNLMPKGPIFPQTGMSCKEPIPSQDQPPLQYPPTSAT